VEENGLGLPINASTAILENSEIGGIYAGKWKIEPSYDFTAARVRSENAYCPDVLLSFVIPYNAPSNLHISEDSISL